MLTKVATMLFFLLYGLSYFVKVTQAGLVIAICALIVGIVMLMDILKSRKA